MFEPTRRVYQRLLAGDQEEAAELVADDLEKRPLVEVYDTLLIPALALAEPDWHCDELDEARHKFILQGLKEMINERDEDQAEVPAKEGNDPARGQRSEVRDQRSEIRGPIDIRPLTSDMWPCILCLPARDEADEIAAMMLASCSRRAQCLVQSVSFTTAAGEVLDLVQKRSPDVVCISATPPVAVTHGRHLCKLVRGRFPQVPVVVGLWNAQGDLSKARARIGGAATTHAVTTLAEVKEQVRRLIQPLLPPPEEQAQTDRGPMVMECSVQA